MLIALIAVSLLFLALLSVHRFTMRECRDLTNYALLLLLSDAFRDETKTAVEDHIKASPADNLATLGVETGKAVDKLADYLGNRVATDTNTVILVLLSLAQLRPDLDTREPT